MSEPAPFKVYVTKYALSSGITVHEVRPTIHAGMVSSVCAIGRQHFHKPHWHRAEAEARAQVLRMIAAKRRTVAKTLARLDALEKRCTSGAPLVDGAEQEVVP